MAGRRVASQGAGTVERRDVHDDAAGSAEDGVGGSRRASRRSPGSAALAPGAEPHVDEASEPGAATGGRRRATGSSSRGATGSSRSGGSSGVSRPSASRTKPAATKGAGAEAAESVAPAAAEPDGDAEAAAAASEKAEPAPAASRKKAPARKAGGATAAKRPATATTDEGGGATAAKARARGGRKAPPLPASDGADPWTREELAAVRAELERELSELRGEIDEDATAWDGQLSQGRDGAGDDQADTGSATFEREQQMSILASRRSQLDQTERALARLAAGTYGICENCGVVIPKARMQARPKVTLCVSCQQREARR